MRTHTKRIFLAFMLALLLVPAAAGATYQRGDSPAAISAANGPRPAVIPADTTPAIVHEIRTVTTHEKSDTLPVVLAALALSVALTATGYVALRVRPMPRS